MKIIKLTSENVKRITAVSIEPDGTLVGIGGKNGAGKSSVLDSIAYALGGKELVPAEPIRAGEAEAKIEVDLGDLIVTRKFARDMEAQTEEQEAANTPKRFGPTRSTLVVTNREGARYPSPQAVLDKLLGKLTFDPLAFSREEPKKQNEILRRLVGLDFTALDARRKEAFDARAMAKRTLAIAEQKAAGMPQAYEATAEEVSLDEVSAEMRRAEELRTAEGEAARANQRAAQEMDAVIEKSDQSAVRLKRLHEILKQTKEDISKETSFSDQCAMEIKRASERLVATQAASHAAIEAIPDVTSIQAKLAAVEANNKKVRANKAREAQLLECVRISDLVTAEQEKIDAADAERASTLAAASFPVPGLGVGEAGPTFEGLPLEQVSSAAQLQVSVAIGLALNPTLKVLLIRNANLLDDDSLAAVAAQAEHADAQIWCEFVTADAAGMTVVMEDGHAR